MGPPNLGDPTVEPTDEQFRELLQRAAVDVRADHRAADIAMREQVRAERTRLRAEFEKLSGPGR